jgi:hypothetical protein
MKSLKLEIFDISRLSRFFVLDRLSCRRMRKKICYRLITHLVPIRISKTFHELIDRYLPLLTVRMVWRRTSQDKRIPELQEKYGSISNLKLESSIWLKILFHRTVYSTRKLEFELSSSLVTYSLQLWTSSIQLSSLSVVQMIGWLSFNAHALSHLLIWFPRKLDPNLSVRRISRWRPIYLEWNTRELENEQWCRFIVK